ncbi:hypothetical protein [Nesterenkonia sp.]|uniref:hypothetical protein n=1 Tax=Nesterenkonia sp. TaxID=704201 RepID=UPI0026104E12|nr:hypothetical protein [Nesterenkonia sp.]
MQTTVRITAACGTLALLGLAACAPDEPATPTAGETADQQQPPHQDGTADTQLPPGGAERMDEGDFHEPLHGVEAPTYFSEEGAEVGFAGFTGEQPLTVRAAPTREAEVVGELGPLDAVLLGGRERNHPALEGQGTWAEVQLAEGHGWYETGRSGSMLYFDRSEDLTEEYADQVPAAEDPQRIAESVAQRAAEQHAEAGVPGPEWTLISTPEDYGEDFYRLDVLGLADDSQAGYRLFVTAEPTAHGHQLHHVESTALCRRGVSDDGLCL